jgi:hypothetical protein
MISVNWKLCIDCRRYAGCKWATHANELRDFPFKGYGDVQPWLQNEWRRAEWCAEFDDRKQQKEEESDERRVDPDQAGGEVPAAEG